MTQQAMQDNAPMTGAAGLTRTCPQCGSGMQTNAELASFDVQCPACGATVPPAMQQAPKRGRLHRDMFAGWGVSTAVHFFLILTFASVTWLSDTGGQGVPAEKPVGVVADRLSR